MIDWIIFIGICIAGIVYSFLVIRVIRKREK